MARGCIWTIYDADACVYEYVTDIIVCLDLHVILHLAL